MSRKYIYLIVILVAAGIVPIFIRNAQLEGVSSVFILFARLSIVSIVLAPIALRRHQPTFRSLTRRDMRLIALAGGLFALNLLFLFLSLEYTSVLVNGVVRRTTPLWVIGLETIWLGAIFSRRAWVGVLLGFVGSLLVAFGTGGAVSPGANPPLGAALALGNAVGAGIYLLIGRRLRHIPSLAYSWLVFSVAAVVSTIAMLFTQTPLLGYTLAGYFWTLLVTIFAQFIAHLAINAGLRYFRATAMSVILQAGVVASAVLAFIFLNEVPTVVQVAGSAMIIGGVLLVSVE